MDSYNASTGNSEAFETSRVLGAGHTKTCAKYRSGMLVECTCPRRFTDLQPGDRVKWVGNNASATYRDYLNNGVVRRVTDKGVVVVDWGQGRRARNHKAHNLARLESEKAKTKQYSERYHILMEVQELLDACDGDTDWFQQRLEKLITAARI